MIKPCDFCGTFWDTVLIKEPETVQIVRCRVCVRMEERANSLLSEAEAIVSLRWRALDGPPNSQCNKM